ncbi:transcriptional regulator [Staphylococcus felis]|uniref:Helix-turn-helix domain-containing protein n=1 Tax=Staphylococcus felis TaxID=46127 RepID=A0A3E0IIR8_9STAP|nr:helix-turn-helix domain-containing protein [Staphylococcus felis]MBH9579911.1 helix-turn-helix domain-containing protein [Staphylococcus felis]MDM8327075.1 helix-turn-helix domain-containing protein [Staphylococcus felis]MDQ7193588.1 helix-turn-helix domain-containing protein [Staphylococcus felis]REH74859.1 transcriptional regulator [Staphylococcus felis]REH75818.1 transcriptional regulator [Staphylococcus felis]
MKLIGEVLKGKRERLGMTLNELEKRTHIQRHVLMSIEKNEFETLNHPEYVRGFIKKYAQVVNTDSQHLLEQHQEELPAIHKSAQEALVQLSNQSTLTNQTEDNQAKQLSLILIIFFVVTAVFWGLLTFML